MYVCVNINENKYFDQCVRERYWQHLTNVLWYSKDKAPFKQILSLDKECNLISGSTGEI